VRACSGTGGTGGTAGARPSRTIRDGALSLNVSWTYGRLLPVAVHLTARDLGARGSRSEVAGSNPAAPLSGAAAAVLASVPGWWRERALEAGLAGVWLDVTKALSAQPPDGALDGAADSSVTGQTTGEQLGAAYVRGLSSAVRARHGRHYTPSALAEQLWTMTRSALGMPGRATRLPGLVRDRACGAGALLIPAVREHVRASARSDAQLALSALPSLLDGLDSDPHAVWLSNVVLSAELLPLAVLLRDPQERRGLHRAFTTENGRNISGEATSIGL
jgi:adenine-specific DNA-methyltransferase